MKHLLPSSVLLILLAGFLTLTTHSCTDTKAGNQEMSQEIKVPYLKDRPETLGSVDERNNVAVKYDAAVAKVKTNANDAESWLSLIHI